MRKSLTVTAASVILLGVLSVCINGCASSPDEPQLSVNTQAGALSHFTLGLLAEANGDTEAALMHFNEASLQDPDEERLYAAAIAAALKLEQKDKAVELAKRFEKSRPNAPEPSLLLAGVYALTGKTELAERAYKLGMARFPDYEELPISLGRFYISEKRNRDAIELFSKFSETHPDNTEILQLLGTLLIDQARTSKDPMMTRLSAMEGIDFLKQTLEADPDNLLCRQQLGYAYLLIDDTNSALKAFQETYERDSGNTALARAVLDLMLQAENYSEVIETALQAAGNTGTEPEAWMQYIAEKFPENEQHLLIDFLQKEIHEQKKAPVFYYTQLSALYIQQEDYDAAEAIIKEALEKYPEESRIRIILGYVYLKQKRFPEAYSELERVRTEIPREEWSQNPFFIYNLTVAAQKEGYLTEAAEILASGTNEQSNVLGQYVHAMLTEQLSMPTQSAIELLNEYRSLKPQNPETYFYLMMLQSEDDEYEAALESGKQFEQMMLDQAQTNRLDGSFYYQYAALHERTGQLEDAEKLFYKAIELGDETTTASAQNYIAYMWAERGEKLETGLELINKALAAAPDNGAFLDTLGWIYYMQGRYPEALETLEKAKESVPDDPTIWEHLGDVHLKLGNQEAAIEHWKKSLEFNPDSDSIKERLQKYGVSPDDLRE